MAMLFRTVSIDSPLVIIMHRRFIHLSRNCLKWRSNVGTRTIDLTNGTLEVETGRLARFTDGSATCKIDYRQKAAAAGRIPTNYLRREMGASDKEILTSRMIDRSLRPLFPPNYLQDTQVVCNLLAMDGENDPEVLSINAASAALSLSDIPWNGPVGAVRVGIVDGNFVANPTRKELSSSKVDLVVTGCANNKVVMLEASSNVVPYDEFTAAIRFGLEKSQEIVSGLTALAASHGLAKREVAKSEGLNAEVMALLHSMCAARIREILCDRSHHKTSRDEAIQLIRADVVDKCLNVYPEIETQLLTDEFHKTVKRTLRELVLDSDIRCDGRKWNEVRPISCSVDLYSALHGSALFQRGQTQVMSTVTFDSPESAAKLDTLSAIMGGVKAKSFFLHYEFPPYATNEIGKSGSYGRRELGHGALAEKSLRPVFPSDFPFTTRLTAEVLESNGSSSMASVCAGSLALMDAGVPLSEAAAGVAMGLVTETNDAAEVTKSQILVDIMGMEDYAGDMDFKIAGTASGVTGLQADVKLPGISMDLVAEAVQKAQGALEHVLAEMSRALAKPRDSRKENGPIIETVEVPAHRRARLVGVGGVNLRCLMAETGATLNAIDESKFQLFAPNRTAYDEAKATIERLLAEQREVQLEFGGVYKVRIAEIRDFGVMVEIQPGVQPVLVHNSQLSHKRIGHPSALNLEVGQEISVKYFGRDPVSGNMRLSRKVLQATTSLRHHDLFKQLDRTSTPDSMTNLSVKKDAS